MTSSDTGTERAIAAAAKLQQCEDRLGRLVRARVIEAIGRKRTTVSYLITHHPQLQAPLQKALDDFTKVLNERMEKVTPSRVTEQDLRVFAVVERMMCAAMSRIMLSTYTEKERTPENFRKLQNFFANGLDERLERGITALQQINKALDRLRRIVAEQQ